MYNLLRLEYKCIKVSETDGGTYIHLKQSRTTATQKFTNPFFRGLCLIFRIKITCPSCSTHLFQSSEATTYFNKYVRPENCPETITSKDKKNS